jgi:hypothetical protein
MSRIGRPAKTLGEHVEDGSFRAREHEHLLDVLDEGWPLLPHELRLIRARFRRAKRPETRRRIALEFERAVTGRRPSYEEQLDKALRAVGP